MKILVTGAAGFIGSHLAEALVQHGHDVIALDALLPELYPQSQKTQNWNRLGELGHKVKLLKRDLRDPLEEQEIRGCDYIFHLAAMPGLQLSWENTKLYIDCNIVATSNLLEAVDQQSLRNFFYISTSSVYGREINGDETSLIAPISPYGVTKLAAENLVSAFSKVNQLSYSIFRLFSVYGPRQRSDMAFNIFIRKMLQQEEINIFGDGSQIRTNTFVGDIVDGLICAIEKSQNGEIYNLCGNEQISVIELVDLISSLLRVNPRLTYLEERSGDQKLTKSTAKKAMDELGFQPKVNLVEGLKQQIFWQMP